MTREQFRSTWNRGFDFCASIAKPLASVLFLVGVAIGATIVRFMSSRAVDGFTFAMAVSLPPIPFYAWKLWRLWRSTRSTPSRS